MLPKKMLEVFGGEWTGDVQSVNGMNIPFWVKVTNSFQYGLITLYAWTEIQWVQSGSYPSHIELPSPRSGTTLVNPFFEPNNCPVPIGSIAKIERAYFDGLFQNIYVSSYIKPCGDPTSTAGNKWYCLKPPEDGGQWYCAEPPAGDVVTPCCPEQPLPKVLYLCINVATPYCGCMGMTTNVSGIPGYWSDSAGGYVFDYYAQPDDYWHMGGITLVCTGSYSGWLVAAGTFSMFDEGQSSCATGSYCIGSNNIGPLSYQNKPNPDECDPFLVVIECGTTFGAATLYFSEDPDTCP